MAQMTDFSPAQIEEAEEWYKKNHPILWEIIVDSQYGGEEAKNHLLSTYFDLKMISIELRPNQFVIGVDYKSTGDAGLDRAKAYNGQIQFNLSFWNPHPKNMTDQLAKDLLLAKLSTL